MSACRACGREMLLVGSCEPHSWTVDGVEWISPPYRPTPEMPERCDDCNVVPGGTHHLDCDQEACPHGQRIACDACSGS
jgi:hypothetical protein